MLLPHSVLFAAALVILQSTLSIAAPLTENAVHELEKRITCQATEFPSNNACVSCASLYKNASTCTRSVPLTCSYGAVNSVRKCAAVDGTNPPGTYLSTDGKQCLSCTDTNALTCNSTTIFACQADYTLFANQCYPGKPYSIYQGFGLSKPYLAKQQPFKPFVPMDGEVDCINDQYQARVYYFTGYASSLCTGQNGPLDQNLLPTTDSTAYVGLLGLCTDFATNGYVTAKGANTVYDQFFVTSMGSVSSPLTGP